MNHRPIIFYNHHQHGDLALSRGIVNWIINKYISKYGNNEFYFSINTNNIYNLTSIYFNKHIKNINHNINLLDHNYIFINTWIGSSPSFMNRTDAPRNGFNNPIDYNTKHILNHCLEIINELHNKYGISLISPSEESDMLPKANKNPLNKNYLDIFLDKIKHFNKKILICNGPVKSLQCPNFSISQNIKKLVLSMPNIAFIYTDNTPNMEKNEFCINDYSPIPNLNEIDYFSTFCDIIVTRRSGPGEIIQTYDNFFDYKKTIISFTSYKEADFVFKNGKCKLDWTNNFSPSSVSTIIKKYL